MQKQAIINPPGSHANTQVVDPPASYVADKQHKPEASPGFSTGLTVGAQKRCFKLQNPLVFTDRKNDLLVEHWLVKMKGKMTANNDLYDSLARCMVYVMNCVSGLAFGHLEPRAQECEGAECV